MTTYPQTEKDTLRLVQNVMHNQKRLLEMVSRSDVISPYSWIYIRDSNSGIGHEKLQEYLE